MTTETTRRPRKREPIPTDKKRALRALQRQMEAGQTAQTRRQQMMADLYEEGWSYSAIAEVVGIHHEAVRKTVRSLTDDTFERNR